MKQEGKELVELYNSLTVNGVINIPYAKIKQIHEKSKSLNIIEKELRKLDNRILKLIEKM
jgi:hypothetical protein